MKKFIKGMGCILGMLVLCSCMIAQAEENNKMLPGIYIEDMPMEGKTAEEAKKTVEEYVGGLLGKSITLVTVGGNEVTITPADIGLFWSNLNIIEEAAGIGKSGNVVKRYKAATDLKYENKVFKLEFDADKELIRHILADQCSIYNLEAENSTLSRVDGQFIINKGQTGSVVDEEASLGLIYDGLTKNWNKQDTAIELAVITDEPKGSEEELNKVKDVLGTFATSFKTSGADRSANVRNGCALINGFTLYPGDEFSTYEAVAPFSSANGYYMAGSYLNGQVVDSLGGGICQVSTTLYNAVLLAELEVTERHNHSMIVTYVNPSADAAIAESSGKDFRFINNTQAPIYIEGYTTEDKQIGFTIYGMETRESSHTVTYESEVISKTYPDTEVIITDAAQPVGNISVQSAHVGYKANLWKVVKENGQEISREMVNSSVYKMVPRTATVGVATEDVNAYNEIMAAVSTNNIDHVKNVAAALKAAVAPPAEAPAEAPPGEAPVQAPPAEAPAEAPAA